MRNDWQVWSYLPLLKAVLKAYRPMFVLELGIGAYSTPLLSKYNYQGIENDKAWISKFKNLNIIFHDLPGIEHLTRLSEISGEKRKEIFDYYCALELPDIHPNLLFVDNYSCCRSIAINALQSWFDIIMFHDCEPEAWVINGYDTVSFEDFKVIYQRTDNNWTGLMVREKKELKVRNDTNIPGLCLIT